MRLGDDAGSSAADPSRSEVGSRRRVWVAAGLVLSMVVLAAWAALAAMSGLGAYRDLDAARGDVIAAERQLRDGSLSEARESLYGAVARADAASAELRRPWVVPLRYAPWLGSNVRAATVLSDAARDNGAAAGRLLDAAGLIVSDDRTQVPGQISIDYLEELGPPARELADSLSESARAIDELDSDGLLGPVGRARDQYLELVGPNLDQAAVAADLLEVMPTFLGAERPRTYLVAAGALSEIRGSGGLLGSWSIMTADEGYMDFEEFVDVDTLPLTDEPVQPPTDDFARRYGEVDALRQYRNANLTPDFPSAAETLLRIWEAGGGSPVDGVIMADTLTYSYLTERAGGLELPGYGSMSASEILEFVGLDAYDVFEDDEERKRVLGLAATATFAELFEILEDDDVPATVEMLTTLADGGHLRIYTRDTAVQEVLERAKVGGELPEREGESPGFFTNNIGGNKVDWFTTRTVEHRLRLLPDGVTEAEHELALNNDAPTEGHRRGVLGPWTEVTEAGDNLAMVTFTCSTSCAVSAAAGGAADGGREVGRPMYDMTLLVPAGDRREVRFRTESERAWHFDGDQIVVEVDHLVQTTLHGTELTIRLEIPSGTSPLRLPDGAEVIDGEILLTERVSGRAQRTFVLDASGLEIAEPTEARRDPTAGSAVRQVPAAVPSR